MLQKHGGIPLKAWFLTDLRKLVKRAKVAGRLLGQMLLPVWQHARLGD
jgi:hypothetical protein